MSKYIMLIEDEEPIRELLEGVITGLGYDVIAFRNGIDAMGIYEKDYANIEMVITDLNMPGMNGYDIIKHIKDINYKEKILLCTGFLKDDIKDKIKYDGVLVLTKPFELSEFSRAITTMLACKNLYK